MRKLIILAAALSPTALAAPFKLTPAKVAAGNVSIEKVTAGELETFHYSEVESAYPYIGIKTVRGVITAKAIKDACGVEARKNLKTPGVAKFVSMDNPTYFENAGTYFTSGEVDSQNSYGAMLRGTYFCLTVFEGNAKGGTLYTRVDFSRN